MSEKFQLRDYQQEAIDATLTHWAEGTNNCLVALPTGTGKTQVAIFLLKQTMKPGQRALFLAHRDELLLQPAEHFQRRWPGARVGTVKANVNEANADIVLASVQTVCKSNRIANILAYGPIDYLVTDECLPYSARVLLADGSARSIGDIVEALDKPEVVCYNGGVLTTRPVSQVWKLRPKAPLVRVTHAQGELICTGNHRLLTQDGWVPAGLLEENYDHLFALREGIQEQEISGPPHGSRERQVQQNSAVSHLREEGGGISSASAHEIAPVSVPGVRRGLRAEAIPGSPHETRAHGLSMQSVLPHSKNTREPQQASLGRTPRLDAGPTACPRYPRVSPETLGKQEGREKSDVWKTGRWGDGPGMVDPGEKRGTKAECPGRVAGRRVRGSANARSCPEAQPARTGLLGNAPRGSPELLALHGQLQPVGQRKKPLQESRLRGAGREDGDRGIRQVLPRGIRSSAPAAFLPGNGLASADPVGRRNTGETRGSYTLDYGVPGPSLVLSVEELPDQEQWVYDLTVDEVHNFIADGVVVSNCHHSVTKTYRAVYNALREANPDLKHVGLTATPQRTDRAGLIDIYDVISYQMNIRAAIKAGWLVPVEGLQIETEIDISGVKIARGDFVTGQLEDVLDTRGWYEKVIEAYQEHASGKQAIAYSPGVLTSRNLCQKFLDAGIRAIHVDGTTARDERRRLMASFRRGDVQVLCNCMIAVEGFDAPSAEVILMCRPTKSHTLFTQIIGRGLRIYPGKEKCLVLLFMTTGAHILTLHDLGESKKLKEAKEKDELLAIKGVSEPLPLFDDATFDGVGLYAKTVDLFGSSKGAWFRDGATFSLALGESGGYDRTLVILPPNDGDNWRLMGLGRKLTSKGAWADKRKTKYGSWGHQLLEESPDVEDLMIMATDIIERVGADIIALRSKKWRKDPASTGQLRYARKWASADVLASLTKGEVAQLITHGVALDTLRKGELL